MILIIPLLLACFKPEAAAPPTPYTTEECGLAYKFLMICEGVNGERGGCSPLDPRLDEITEEVKRLNVGYRDWSCDVFQHYPECVANMWPKTTLDYCPTGG